MSTWDRPECVLLIMGNWILGRGQDDFKIRFSTILENEPKLEIIGPHFIRIAQYISLSIFEIRQSILDSLISQKVSHHQSP